MAGCGSDGGNRQIRREPTRVAARGAAFYQAILSKSESRGASKTALATAYMRAAHQLIDSKPSILDDPLALRILNRTGTSSKSAGPHNTVWTVGHSTRTLEEFLAALTAFDVGLVADVRRFPASRRLPHFNAAELERGLAAAGIDYKWLPSLGGRRQARPDSPNGGWTHPAFRGYADYMATEDFAEGLTDLLILSGGLRTAVMCAELLWWRCHRRIISDVLVSLDYEVLHIRDARFSENHRLVSPARLVGGELTYPPEPPLQLGLTFGNPENR